MSHEDASNDPLSTRILGGQEGLNSTPLSTEFSGDMTASKLSENVKNRIFNADISPDDSEDILKAVTFENPTQIGDIVSALRNYGVAILPAIYDENRLSKVRAEYEALMGDAGKEFLVGADERMDTPFHSLGMKYSRKTLPENYSEIHALFGSKTIEIVTGELFSGQPYDFNSGLYFQRTLETEAPASGVLHWDKQYTLKSWLYVTDATPQFGPMRAAAGSNRWLRYAREDAMFDGVPYGAIDNSVNEAGLPVVSTGGPAGTFFLFLTDTAHGASKVEAGLERNIIRAQSRPHRIASWAAWANKKAS